MSVYVELKVKKEKGYLYLWRVCIFKFLSARIFVYFYYTKANFKRIVVCCTLEFS